MKEIDEILRKQIDEKRSPSIQYVLFGKDKMMHTRRGRADCILRSPYPSRWDGTLAVHGPRSFLLKQERKVKNRLLGWPC